MTTDQITEPHQPCVNATDRNHAKRPTIVIGPRLGAHCTTCRRERKRTIKVKRRSARLSGTYGLSPEDVDAIVALMPQNSAGVRVCFGCRRATGATKALAADHDHELERMGLPIRETVRGFLCGPCNQIIGRFTSAGLRRLALYLDDPPAFHALGTNGRPKRLR